MARGDAGGACVDAREELGGQGGDDEQDGSGVAEAEVAGGEVGAVAQFARGFAYAFRRGLGDAAAPFVAEDQGDGGLGDMRRPGRRHGSWAVYYLVPLSACSLVWTRGQGTWYV